MVDRGWNTLDKYVTSNIVACDYISLIDTCLEYWCFMDLLIECQSGRAAQRCYFVTEPSCREWMHLVRTAWEKASHGHLAVAHLAVEFYGIHAYMRSCLVPLAYCLIFVIQRSQVILGKINQAFLDDKVLSSNCHISISIKPHVENIQ